MPRTGEDSEEHGVTDEAPDLELRRWQSEALLNLQRIRHVAERRVEGLLTGEGLDVTPAQANVLMILIAARRPLTARLLADDMQLSQVTVGRFLKALERGGWVSRERDPADARAILVQPTARAREALPRFIRVSNSMLDLAFAGFEREQIAAMAEVTRVVRDNLRE